MALGGQRAGLPAELPERSVDQVVRANDVFHVYAMASAHTFVQALRKAGRNPTRSGVMAQLARLNSKNPFAIPGVTIKTGRTDRFPVEQVQLTRWTVNRKGDGRWVRFGPLQRTPG